MKQHADVMTALELVTEEIGKESQNIQDAGSVALKVGKFRPAQKAIAFAKKMRRFAAKVKTMGEEWQALLQEVDGAAPEVKEIVRPVQTQHLRKTGFARNVGKIAPRSNFCVTFSDGTTISLDKSYEVMGAAIEKLGTAKVAALNLQLGGEPLVTTDRSLYKKHPAYVFALSDGWFVKTHSSTQMKMNMVQRAAKALGVKVRVKKVEKTLKDIDASRSRKAKTEGVE